MPSRFGTATGSGSPAAFIDPRMKREGLHYVVIERNEKYMANFDEMVPEFIEKMDVALAEIGFVFGEQWR